MTFLTYLKDIVGMGHMNREMFKTDETVRFGQILSARTLRYGKFNEYYYYYYLGYKSTNSPACHTCPPCAKTAP